MAEVRAVSKEVGARRDSTAAAKGGVRAIAAILLLCAMAVIVWQVVDGAKPDGTTVSAFLAGAIATMALAYPRSFVSLGQRISNVDAFGVKLELRVQEAELAIAQFENEEDGASFEPPAWPTSNRKAMELIATELRGKLRFSSVAVLGNRAKISEEYIVDNLGTAGLLNFNEAVLCRDLLGDLYKRLDELGTDERETFLRHAWEFASRFASRTFDRQARRDLTNGGWKVADFSQKKGHRADFIAVREGTRALIAARVAAPRENVLTTGGRIAGVDFPLPELRRLVIVPDHVDGLWNELDNSPMKVHERVLIMRVGDLIANPELASRDPATLTQVTA